MSCARQQNKMGDNATLIIFLGFAIYLVSLFPATYCSVPVKIQSTTHTANNEQEKESTPTAGERMGWSERMRNKGLREQPKAGNEIRYGHRSLVL